MEWFIVLKWLLVLAALAVAGAPLSAWLFPTLPRRGGSFALPITLLGVALVTFWIGQITYGVHTVVLAVLVVAGVSGLVYWRGTRPDWRAVAGGVGVFAVGFLLLVLFRGSNPGITPAGGEQFLHFGLTRSLERAPALPPADFWFAGEPIRYYYGSQLQVTSLSMLTGTPLRFGFNLGIATFYGTLFVAAYGLAGAVTHAAGYSYRLGGALGAFFTAVGGAFTVAVRLVFGILPEDIALEYGRAAFGAIRHMPYEEAVVTQSNPAEWFWFYTRYVVPETLQEFPLYSFIKADLHGHALSTGYVVLAAALAYSYYRLPAEQRGRRLAVLFGGLGVAAGVFGFMNTWSLPTAVGLTVLAVATADAHPSTLMSDSVADRLRLFSDESDDGGDSDGVDRLGAELWRIALAVVPAVLVGIIGVALASPFLVFGHVPTNEGIGFFPPRTALGPFLVIYGAILALFAGYLLTRAWPAVRTHDRRVLAGVLAAGVVAVGALLTVLSFPVLAVLGPLLVTAWWLVRTDRAGFEAVLLVAGLGLVLSMEVVHARVAPWNLVRWNTTLKVAVQGWTLAGVAAGATGALLLGDARTALAGLRTGTEETADGQMATADGGSIRRVVPAVLAGLLVVAVVIASSPFVALAGTQEVVDTVASDSEMTLDGLATHERWKGAQMAAIAWLDDREGSPTIVEAPGDAAYRWTNPTAVFTGLPTVVGWQNHQENYRGEAAVERRVAAVDAIYAGQWEAGASALAEYEIQYVVVGPNERDRYGEDLRAFGDREALSVAFENEQVTIYQVDHAALPAG